MSNKTSGFNLILLGILILGLFFAVFFLLEWAGLINDRHVQKYQEETRAQTYDTSRQYNQGMNRDIARYCEQMRGASNDSAKKAVAALIRSNVSTFDGNLTDDNKDCVSEAKGM